MKEASGARSPRLRSVTKDAKSAKAGNDAIAHLIR